MTNNQYYFLREKPKGFYKSILQASNEGKSLKEITDIIYSTYRRKYSKSYMYKLRKIALVWNHHENQSARCIYCDNDFIKKRRNHTACSKKCRKKIWDRVNRDYKAEQKKAWDKENRERVIKYRKENIEHRREENRKWFANREKVRKLPSRTKQNINMYAQVGRLGFKKRDGEIYQKAKVFYKAYYKTMEVLNGHKTTNNSK